jgi:capsular polysaccharide biosynthesis protein/GGDEF domain-containing protein
MQPQDIIKMAQRSWWIIVLCTLAALNAALINSYRTVPLYRSSFMRFVVTPSAALLASTDDVILRSMDVLDKRTVVSTFVEVMNSPNFFKLAADGIELSGKDVGKYTWKAMVLPEASVLQVYVEGPNPEIAALLANELGQISADYIHARYPVYDIQLLEKANASSTATNMTPGRDAGVAVFVGLAMGSFLAFIREYFATAFSVVSQLKPGQSTISIHSWNSFQTLLQEEVTKNKNEPIALALVQLAVLGNITPDWVAILDRAGEILQEELRILAKEVFIAYWGETSLVIFLPKTTGKIALDGFERVRKVLMRPLHFEPLENETEQRIVFLKPQIGVVPYQEGEPLTIVLERIETALKWTHQNNAKTVLLSNN